MIGHRIEQETFLQCIEVQMMKSKQLGQFHLLLSQMSKDFYLYMVRKSRKSSFLLMVLHYRQDIPATVKNMTDDKQEKYYSEQFYLCPVTSDI